MKVLMYQNRESMQFYLANGLGVLAFLGLTQYLVGPLIITGLLKFMAVPIVLVIALKLIDAWS
jgi:hypothetical protein